MASGPEWESSDSDEEYSERPITHRRKRRKVVQNKEESGKTLRLLAESSVEPFFTPLISALEDLQFPDDETSFEQFIEPFLLEYSQSIIAAQERCIGLDDTGETIRLMSRLQAKRILDELTSASHAVSWNTAPAALATRKLKLYSNPLRAAILGTRPTGVRDGPVTPLPVVRSSSSVNPQVLDALYAIKSTRYENSFLSRLQGFQPSRTPGVIATDWNTRAPWMDLMRDVREHFTFMHPDREPPVEVEAPIDYSTLRPDHLPQVHELLGRVFWVGIDVSDSLQYAPEKCTIVATYKKLVVGAAFLSSPQETYITYLAVMPGWDNAQIATCMLYHLINMNPRKDITLHVSINNPAMLLYNRFGFKAEEFIVGFYEDYLDSQSRASKNAFRLRLRR